VWRCGTCGGPSPEGSWHRLGGTDLASGALPKVEVDRLSLTHNFLIAWTHGRGIWKISLPPATTTSTSLSGAGQTGAKITVPSGTEVTDQATLAGENKSTATGSVTYTWYSDAACTNVVSGPDKHTITTAGTIPASNGVTLNNPGTYHAVASYGGNPDNGASRSHCGDETATVP
jgi:hypothetical protein